MGKKVNVKDLNIKSFKDLVAYIDNNDIDEIDEIYVGENINESLLDSNYTTEGWVEVRKDDDWSDDMDQWLIDNGLLTVDM